MNTKKYTQKLFKPKSIEDAIAHYRKAHKGPSENIELEVRLKNVTQEAFIRLIGEMKGEIECSVNTIAPDIVTGGNKIRRMVYRDGAKVIDETAIKVPLMEPLHMEDHLEYSINVAMERPEKVSVNSPEAKRRFKIRLSEEAGEWRLDATATRTIAFDAANMGPAMALKDKLFGPFKGAKGGVEAFKTVAPEIDHYEVELEYVGAQDSLNLASFGAIKGLFGRLDGQYGDNVKMASNLRYVAKLLGKENFVRPSLKTILPQVVGLNKINYSEIYPPEGYYLTEKADGFRALAILREYDAGGFHFCILADKYYEINTEGLGAFKATIVDAEMLANGAKDRQLLVFDVIMLRGQLKTGEAFDARVESLIEAAGHIGKITGVKIMAKKFVRLEIPILQEQIEGMVKAKRAYEIDGLIFNAPGMKYGAQMMYKWKPPEKNTIDFLAVKVEAHYLLFVGIDGALRERLGIDLVPGYEEMMGRVVPGWPIKGASLQPVQFSPSAAPKAYIWAPGKALKEDVDGKIVEMLYDAEKGQWKLERVRVDRAVDANYYGNYYTLAESTFLNSINPLTIEGLYNPAMGYFEVTGRANDSYEGQKRFKRLVIGKYIKDYYKGGLVVGLAEGRGADLPRYIEVGVETLLAIDTDITALGVLALRKINLSKKIRNRMAIFTLAIDLKTPWKATMGAIEALGADQLKGKGASLVMCNFALHYFCDTVENLRNILLLASALLQMGGHFVFTVMDGASIFELLKADGAWVIKEGEATKYEIRRLYEGDSLADVGQKIAIKLPFATQLYEEPLCNVDYVIEEAKIIGLDLVISESFGRYEGAPLVHNVEVTADDLKYIGLHKIVVLKKMRAQH